MLHHIQSISNILETELEKIWKQVEDFDPRSFCKTDV